MRKQENELKLNSTSLRINIYTGQGTFEYKFKIKFLRKPVSNVSFENFHLILSLKLLMNSALEFGFCTNLRSSFIQNLTEAHYSVFHISGIFSSYAFSDTLLTLEEKLVFYTHEETLMF